METCKRANTEGWQIAKKVVSYDKPKWAINSFKPNKSAGMDGIYSMLHRGPDIVYRRLQLT